MTQKQQAQHNATIQLRGAAREINMACLCAPAGRCPARRRLVTGVARRVAVAFTAWRRHGLPCPFWHGRDP
eukprot:1443025-Alexandrium_andersonii.AAC.1